jgi:Fe-S cluster assembly protein SufD
MSALLTDETRAVYAASFGDWLVGQAEAPTWLRHARQRAFDAFLQQGWPDRKQEAWRFTDVTPLVGKPVLPGPAGAPDPRWDGQLLALARRGRALQFLDGRYQAGDEPASQPAGLRVIPLAQAIAGGSRRLGQVLGRELQSPDAFAALNTAFMTDGAFIEIPPGLALEMPLFLVYLAAGERGASFPRTVVLGGTGSRATIVEVHLGAQGRATLSNAVTEVVLEPGARLAYHTLSRPSDVGFHVGHLAVTQQAGSTFCAQSLVLGGRLVRHDAHVVLAGEGCTTQLDGIYLAAGESHVDNQTSIDHRSPKCTSRESYRGAVAGRGQAVWSGRATVRPGAQGTDARQSSRNLVLSDGAVVHAKPHLEIFANDVKCSHGATTGHLDLDALFYLRSRGLSEPDARRMLVEAFLHEGLGAVGDLDLRERLQRVVAAAVRPLVWPTGGTA